MNIQFTQNVRKAYIIVFTVVIIGCIICTEKLFNIHSDDIKPIRHKNCSMKHIGNIDETESDILSQTVTNTYVIKKLVGKQVNVYNYREKITYRGLAPTNFHVKMRLINVEDKDDFKGKTTLYECPLTGVWSPDRSSLKKIFETRFATELYRYTGTLVVSCIGLFITIVYKK